MDARLFIFLFSKNIYLIFEPTCQSLKIFELLIFEYSKHKIAITISTLKPYWFSNKMCI